MRAIEILKEYYYEYGAWYDSNNEEEYDVSFMRGHHDDWIKANEYGSYFNAFASGLIRVATPVSHSVPRLYMEGSTFALTKSRKYIRNLIEIMKNNVEYMRNGGEITFDVYKDISKPNMPISRSFLLPDDEKKLEIFIRSGFK